MAKPKRHSPRKRPPRQALARATRDERRQLRELLARYGRRRLFPEPEQGFYKP